MRSLSKFDSLHHVSDVDLQSLSDGELKPRKRGQVERHISACWECRSRLLALERTQDAVVKFQRRVQSCERLAPPDSMGMFRQRLQNEARAADRESSSQPKSARSITRSLATAFARVTALPQARPFAIAASVLIIACAGMWWALRSGNTRSAMASELLRTATIAEQRELVHVNHPVVYQKVEIRVDGRRFERSVYRDTVKARHVAHLENINKATAANAARALERIEYAFSAARLDWQAPLSPSRWGNWRSALRVKSDSVRDERGIIEIRTTTEEGPIAEAALRFRESDLHPISSEVRLQQGATVEIAELDYRVVELSQLSPDIFAPLYPQPAMETPSLPARVVMPPVEFDLRVDVLSRLDSVGAFLTDQLSVVPVGDGSVRVEGIVESDARQAEMLTALGPLAHSPWVHVEIKSSDEIETQERKPSKPLQVQTLEVPVTSTAQNPFVRAFLSSGGKRPEQALQTDVQSFSVRAFDHSIQAQLHALALKQMVNASSSQMTKASPKALQQWRALVTKHARAVQQEVSALHEQLAAVFPRGEPEEPAADVDDTNDLYGAVARLCELASTTDRTLWKVLSSADESIADLSKDSGYWKSLKGEEVLAAAIAERAAHWAVKN